MFGLHHRGMLYQRLLHSAPCMSKSREGPFLAWDRIYLQKRIRFRWSHIICIWTREIAQPVARSLSFRIAETVIAADRPFPHFTTRVAIRKGGRWKGGNCEHPMGERNLPVPRVLRAVAGRAELGLKSRALCGATDSFSTSLVPCCACFGEAADYNTSLIG